MGKYWGEKSMRAVYLAPVLFVLAICAMAISGAQASENTSWLADDPRDYYHEGTLAFLGDPSGRGLSVYDNYVFYINGSDFLRSSWKAPKGLPPDRSWAWGSGDIGTWAYSRDGGFITYDMLQPPAYVHMGGNAVPYSSLSTVPFYDNQNHLYIQGERDWARQIAAPVGSQVWLLAYTKKSGPADVYRIGPNSTTKVTRVSLPSGYSHMSFDANMEGRYIISFLNDAGASESVVIDVLPAEYWPTGAGTAAPRV